MLPQVHANSVLEDRNLQQMRHLTWAQRQRQIFLRQRQERALAYAQSGVPVRPAYVLAAQANAAALASNEGLGEDGAFHPDGLASHRAADLCGPRPCTTGSIRSYVARWGNHSQQAPEAWGEGLQGSISLPKPTYRKVRSAIHSRQDCRRAHTHTHPPHTQSVQILTSVTCGGLVCHAYLRCQGFKHALPAVRTGALLEQMVRAQHEVPPRRSGWMMHLCSGMGDKSSARVSHSADL